MWAEDVTRAVRNEFRAAQRKARQVFERASDERGDVVVGERQDVQAPERRRRIVKGP